MNVTDRPITAFFLDVGGVLLTNGWDRAMRARAAERFALDQAELDERHHLTYDTYEEGKLSLDEYLTRVVFHRERLFSREEFKALMFAHRIALDLAQTSPEQVAYIEDRPMFVEVARGLGLRGIHHTSYEGTRAALAHLGLSQYA